MTGGVCRGRVRIEQPPRREVIELPQPDAASLGIGVHVVQEVTAVGQKQWKGVTGVSLLEPRHGGPRSTARSRSAKDRAGWIRAEQHHLFVIPRTTSPQCRCERPYQSSVEIDALEPAVRVEREGTVIRRPKRLRCTAGSGQRTYVARVEPTHPQIWLAVHASYERQGLPIRRQGERWEIERLRYRRCIRSRRALRWARDVAASTTRRDRARRQRVTATALHASHSRATGCGRRPDLVPRSLRASSSSRASPISRRRRLWSFSRQRLRSVVIGSGICERSAAQSGSARRTAAIVSDISAPSNDALPRRASRRARSRTPIHHSADRPDAPWPVRDSCTPRCPAPCPFASSPDS